MRYQLVAGAAGFIGASLCEKLISDGINIIGVDSLHDYYDPKLKLHRIENLNKFVSRKRLRLDGNVRGSFKFIRSNIENFTTLSKIFSEYKIDCVYNMAARAGVRRSTLEPEKYLKTNVLGELNILGCQAKYGVKKHILASSSSVYGEQPTPFVETQNSDAPVSPYAASKKSAELLAHTFHKNHGIDVSVLRFFTVYGPAGRPDMAPFVFTQKVLSGEPVWVNGTGDQARDFTYVDDIVSGTAAAAIDVGFEIFNLGGGGVPTSVNKLLKIIEKESKKTAQITRKATSVGDVFETAANIEKAKKILKWTPKINMETGVARLVQWHTENEALVKSLKEFKA